MAGFGRAVIGLFVSVGLLAGCTAAAPSAKLETAAPSPAGMRRSTILPPSPSALAPTPPPTLAPPPGEWTTYVGVNEIRGLAFGPERVLWAATTGGLARWDLATDTYTQYTAGDGLVSSYANDVAVAPDGSVWVALLGGVSHLEGSTCTSYTAADGLADDAVQSIAVTSAGEVWVGTVSGISRFDGHSWTSFLPDARAWKVAVAPDGSVWAANDGLGVSRYSPVDGTFTTYGTEQGLPDGGVKTIAVAPDGGVWIYVGYGQVYRYDGTHWEGIAGTSAPWVCDIAFNTDGAPWIATCPGLHGGGYGLLAPTGSGWERVTSEQGLGSDAVLAVAAGPDGLIAAGTTLGLSIFQDGHWRTLMGGPARNQVTAVAVTPDGAVWLAYGDFAYGAGGGVSRFDGEAWQHFLDDANVQVLAVDPWGTLWAGTGCDLVRWDGQAWTHLGGCEGLMGSVVDLAFGPDGEAWVASGMRLGRLDGAGWTFFDRNISSVAVAPNGTLWVSGWKGTQGSDYTARFDGSAWVEYPGRHASLAVTLDGQVWAVAADQGLVRFDGQVWSVYEAQNGTGLSSIGRLTTGPDGSLWAMGSGSVAHLDGGTWQVYPGAGAAAIAFAPDGSLWLGTVTGAVHFSPSNG